jgi:hypothetical protein
MGMLWLILTADRGLIAEYKDSLEPYQKQIMEIVSKHRMKIWLQGMGLGLVLAIVLGRFVISPLGLGPNANACAFTAILMGVNYMYYMLAPKGTYMISHLRKDQVPGWLAVSKMMQRRYTMGLLLGLVGSFLLSKDLPNLLGGVLGGQQRGG